MRTPSSLHCPLVALLFFASAAACCFAAPPKVEVLAPSGGQRGQTISLTADGSFSHWPASVWIDRGGVDFEPESDKGKFKVKVTDVAAPGVYWLRIHDEEGATPLRPFFVDTLPEKQETEPNNDVSGAEEIPQSMVINGQLRSNGDVDVFAFRALDGQTLVAAVQANQTLGSPMDAVLQLCDANGFVLEQNDDQRGIDPGLAFQAPRDGVYLVRLFAFPATPNSTIGFAGGKTYAYRLTLTTDGFIDHVMPLAVSADQSGKLETFGWSLPEQRVAPLIENLTAYDPELSSHGAVFPAAGHVVVASPDSSLESPQLIEVPADITGRLDHPGVAHAFRFQARKDQKLACRVESDSLGFLLDPVIQLYSAEGKMLAEEDDSRRQRDCTLTQTIPEDGEYRLLVRDAYGHGGFRYVYRLTVTEAQPDFTLTLDSESFVLTPGKPLDISVSIDRQNGFSGRIEITATGLPASVQAQAASSEEKGDAAKSVTLKFEASDGPFSGPIQIIGKAADDLQRVASFGISGTSLRHTQAWLTVRKPPTE